MDRVALREQQLTKVRAVLPGDFRNQRGLTMAPNGRVSGCGRTCVVDVGMRGVMLDGHHLSVVKVGYE